MSQPAPRTAVDVVERHQKPTLTLHQRLPWGSRKTKKRLSKSGYSREKAESQILEREILMISVLFLDYMIGGDLP